MGDKIFIGLAALVTCWFSAFMGALVVGELGRLWRSLEQRWRTGGPDERHVLGAVGTRSQVSAGGTVTVLGPTRLASLAISALVGHLVIAAVVFASFVGVVMSWMVFSFIWLLDIALGAMAVGFTIGVLVRMAKALWPRLHTALYGY